MQRNASIIVYLGILLCGVCVCSHSLQAQAPARPSGAKQEAAGQPGFLNGYALNGHDTIRCKLAFNHGFPYPNSVKQITIDFDGEIMTFDAADCLITGFGVEDGSKKFDYGIILESNRGPKQNGYYTKKLVAGSIDLYESLINTKLYNPNSGSSNNAQKKTATSQYTVDGTQKIYFIGKYDQHANAFINPVRLQALKKVWLAPFIVDHPALLETIPKKFNKKELTRIVKDYNYWKLKMNR